MLLYSFFLTFKHNFMIIFILRVLSVFNFRGLNCNVLLNGPSAKMVPDHVRIKPTWSATKE